MSSCFDQGVQEEKRDDFGSGKGGSGTEKGREERVVCRDLNSE